MGEGVNSIVRECYHLCNEIVNWWCALLIDFISTSKYHDTRRTRITRADSQRQEKYLWMVWDRSYRQSVSLKTVDHFLDGDPLEAVPSPAAERTTPSKKRDYNTRSTPSKLEERANEPAKQAPNAFLPSLLFHLYPLLVSSLR